MQGEHFENVENTKTRNDKAPEGPIKGYACNIALSNGRSFGQSVFC